MLAVIARHLEERSRLVPLYAIALSVVLLGLDFTIPDLRVSNVFLIPVALAAWFGARTWGVLLGIALPLIHAAFSLTRTTPQATYEIAVNAPVLVLVLSGFALLSRAYRREDATPEQLLPVCAWCKRVRQEDNSWISAADYLYLDKARSVTSGICPDCRKVEFG